MHVDPREQRLRSAFGFMMVWTAVAVWVLGGLLGRVLAQAYGGAALALGHAPGESSATALNFAGHVVVGAVVIVAIVRAYLAPPPDSANER